MSWYGSVEAHSVNECANHGAHPTRLAPFTGIGGRRFGISAFGFALGIRLGRLGGRAMIRPNCPGAKNHERPTPDGYDDGVAEEIFDVVNASDEVIGRAPRSEVHRLGWRHRATHMLVTNSRGEVYVQQRSLSKDMSPGQWDTSAAGHLDAGEDYDACAVRELGEELGFVPAQPPERLFKLDASPETGMEFCWVYRVQHDGPITCQASELRGGGWFPPEAVDAWLARRPADFTGAFQLIWAHFRREAILGEVNGITYRRSRALEAGVARELYVASTLGERRPIDEPGRLEAMLAGANLLVTAWAGPTLVGLARSVSDFSYCTYLSDLAVRASHQRRGIGRELIRHTRVLGGPAQLILLSAPRAVVYYPHLGFQAHPSAWTLAGHIVAKPSTS